MNSLNKYTQKFRTVVFKRITFVSSVHTTLAPCNMETTPTPHTNLAQNKQLQLNYISSIVTSSFLFNCISHRSLKTSSLPELTYE
jgi:hypothetical protein